MPINIPPLWRGQLVDSYSYPITAVAATQGTKSHLLDYKKILTGQGDFLSRLFLHVSGNVVVAGASSGTATGAPNPWGLLNLTNVTTNPIYGNVTPFNGLTVRTIRSDELYNRGWATQAAALTDAAGTQAVDFWIELNARRSDKVAYMGIEYALAMGRYTSVLHNSIWGGRDQLFSGGANTWDLSGLTVDVWADVDTGTSPDFIHASELFENNYPITASQTAFQITDLPPGFIYTDFIAQTEDGGALVDTVLNNWSITVGGQTWTFQGGTNASAIRRLYGYSNGLVITDQNAVLTGLYALPMRDQSFLRGFDARFAPITMTLNVHSVSATSNLRLMGRRIVPGAVYTAAKQPGK